MNPRPATDTTAAPALWDVAGLANRLGVAERRVPFYKIGKFIRFDPDGIDAWLTSAHIENR